jgi:hypothetical protein
MNIKSKRNDNNKIIESIDLEVSKLKEGNRNGIKIRDLRKEKDKLIKENIALKKILDFAKPYSLHSTTPINCPRCGKASLKQYSLSEKNSSVYQGSNDVGRCNRTGIDKSTGAAKCGYHYSIYDHLLSQYNPNQSKGIVLPNTPPTAKPDPKTQVYNFEDYLNEAVKGGNLDKSPLYIWFIQNCANAEIVRKVFEMYYVGSGDYSAIKGIYNASASGVMFPYIGIFKGKKELTNIQRIVYNGCNRKKGKHDTGSIGHKLNKRYGVKKETRKERGIFGAHLIPERKDYLYILCESEKTALAITINSMLANEKIIGLASGGCGKDIFKNNYLEPLRNCSLIYSPDAEKAEEKKTEYQSIKAVKAFNELNITFRFPKFEYTPEQVENKDDLFDIMVLKNKFMKGFKITPNTTPDMIRIE